MGIWVTLSDAHGLLLAQGPYGVSGVEPGWAKCKVNALSTGLSLQPSLVNFLRMKWPVLALSGQVLLLPAVAIVGFQ